MSENENHSREDLAAFVPSHDSFVGIDSDGCVFDTMEIKQKQCFHAEIVKHWELEAIEPLLRESAEFVNLYSTSRGRNRFPCLVESIDLLRERPEVRASGVSLPAFKSLRAFMASGAPMGNPGLQQAVQETGDPELEDVLEWSLAVNRNVEDLVKNIPPFKWVRESLEKIKANSDAIVVSQTPVEALVREWRENEMEHFVSMIAGQEMGTKIEHLELATKGRYTQERVLMIGDAPGDRKAAKANGALFYPINPAHEKASWKRFYTEAYDMFLAGEYAGAYEEAVIEEFDALLPDTPPWLK